MRVAFVTGLLGMALSFLTGIRVLGMSVKETALCLLASAFSGLVALLTTLRSEQRPWIKNHFLRGALPTWALLVTLYFGILLALAPQMRDLERLEWMFWPLMLAQGWTLMVFGPIQDRIVRRSQRRARAAA